MAKHVRLWLIAMAAHMYFFMASESTGPCQPGESSFNVTVVNETKVLTIMRESKQARGETCFIFSWFCRTKYRIVYTLGYVPHIVRETNVEVRCCPGYTKESGQCVSGCESGTYGTNCTLNCTCPMNNTYDHCDRESGACFCLSGFHGQHCNQSCLEGYYGPDCKERCTCKNNSTCNTQTGDCNCTSPGWTGETCSDVNGHRQEDSTSVLSPVAVGLVAVSVVLASIVVIVLAVCIVIKRRKTIQNASNIGNVQVHDTANEHAQEQIERDSNYTSLQPYTQNSVNEYESINRGLSSQPTAANQSEHNSDTGYYNLNVYDEIL